MYIYLRKLFILLVTCIIVFLIDRYTKVAVLELLHQENTQIFKVNSFLNFIEIWNRGISFGLFNHYNLPPLFFIGTTIVIIILILLLMQSTHSILKGIIIGGALGNAADRFLFGSVFDFIDLHAYNWHYPAFNIADSFIVLSIIIIIITSFAVDNNICCNNHQKPEQ